MQVAQLLPFTGWRSVKPQQAFSGYSPHFVMQLVRNHPPSADGLQCYHDSTFFLLSASLFGVSRDEIVWFETFWQCLCSEKQTMFFRWYAYFRFHF